MCATGPRALVPLPTALWKILELVTSLAPHDISGWRSCSYLDRSSTTTDARYGPCTGSHASITCMDKSSSVPDADLGPDQRPQTSAITALTSTTVEAGKQPRLTPTPPPYWNLSRESSFDDLSANRPPPITLEDHTLSPEASSSGLWAKSVTIDEYVIVRGNPLGAGAYVVYNCNVQTLDGGPMTIRKRYSEFDELRAKLIEAFPQSTKSSLPPLPPKSAVYKFRPNFLEKRREGLAYFLNCVMLNPEYAGSTIVKDFISLPGT